MDRERLLNVEDDEDIRTQLKYALQEQYQVTLAENRREALAAVRELQPSVVTLDLGLPPEPDSAGEGLKALEEILDVAPGIKVVVITGNSDRANALKAVDLGAFDFHLKPVNLDDLRVVLGRATYLRQLERESEQRTRQEERAVSFRDILGTTQKMREIFNVISRVAKTDATVLIEGESGTGKELIARAIHTSSPRRNAPFVAINCGAIPETLLESELFGHEKGSFTGPFVAINCGAIPETLLESELFGHEKGSFTGAHVQRKGKIEVASGGTLFLDEIGEMSVPLQVKLLRFLQEREIERVGGREPIRIDVRVLAATNSHLEQGIQKGTFREDLFYRLSVVAIRVPPLRERGEDIVLLANVFLRRAGQTMKRKTRFSAAALEALVRYPWPGNIRELENKVQRAVIMTTGRTIEPADLELSAAADAPLPTLREARSGHERKLVIDALARSGGNISRAAQSVGVSRPTFHEMLARHGIDAKAFR
ncbi:MAG: sigma 54-interacting transcriptional regulator [Candidatus Rokubacteria bacterium]|nr:sigma 54-interacting transcriptional regulator [Candidatus Rokubacteria bacterium]